MEVSRKDKQNKEEIIFTGISDIGKSTSVEGPKGEAPNIKPHALS